MSDILICAVIVLGSVVALVVGVALIEVVPGVYRFAVDHYHNLMKAEADLVSRFQVPPKGSWGYLLLVKRHELHRIGSQQEIDEILADPAEAHALIEADRALWTIS